jgi:hypothetical protein
MADDGVRDVGVQADHQEADGVGAHVDERDHVPVWGLHAFN